MRVALPCPKCESPLRLIAYRTLVEEDPNQNFKRIPGVYYCVKEKKFVKLKAEVLKVG